MMLRYAHRDGERVVAPFRAFLDAALVRRQGDNASPTAEVWGQPYFTLDSKFLMLNDTVIVKSKMIALTT